MKSILVKLTCLTNLHVGNGDINYNIVDNEVEKDPVTNLPTINASGVKGALRNHFKNLGNNDIIEWFGSGPKDKDNRSPGKIKILSANLLARPYRATSGKKPYQLVATEEGIKQYKNLCESFGIDGIDPQKNDLTTRPKNVEVERKDTKTWKCINCIGTKNIFIDDSQELKNVELPVMARNYLENGISKNLWYEEVVPHESIFYFIATAEDCDENAFNRFKEAINNSIIQFGANASIGYGLCKVEIKGENHNDE